LFGRIKNAPTVAELMQNVISEAKEVKGNIDQIF